MKRMSLSFGLALCLMSVSPAFAAQDLAGLFKPKAAQFLPVSQAFSVNAKQEKAQIVVSISVTPKHYFYKDKLKLLVPDELKSALQVGEWQFDRPATFVDDPEFGRVAVFRSDVVARLPIQASKDIKEQMTLTWQGCAEAGLCYPPERVRVAIDIKGDGSTEPSSPQEPSEQKPSPATKEQKNNKDSDTSTPTTLPKPTDTVPELAPKALTEADNDLEQKLEQEDVSNQATPTQNIANQDATQPTNSNHQTMPVMDFGLSTHPVLAVFLLFLAGLGLAFSACVYPMIPIVANIIAKSDNPSTKRAFLLTLSYALGVSTSYGLLGAVIAWFGRSLGVLGWLQNPMILLGFAFVFVLLGSFMMGFLPLRLPSRIKDKLSKTSQAADGRLGSLSGSFWVGALSSLVVSPCVSAPMAGALLSVSVMGNVLLGFVALFALGFGLSVPLIVVGTLQGRFMPKSGAWMDSVKMFAGLLLFAVAILLLGRVFVEAWLLLVWAAWFFVLAAFLWRHHALVLRALALFAAVWAATLVVGFQLNSKDPWQPLSTLDKPQAAHDQQNKDLVVHSLAQLDQALGKHSYAVVEVTADWCIECRIMQKTLFDNPPAELADWQVIRLDVTDTNEDSQAVLERYQLFGPPALLYYKDGALVDRQLGEVSRSDFVAALKQW